MSKLHNILHNDDSLCMAPFPERRREKIKWCHVPKASSTFFTTVFRYACVESEEFYVGAPTKSGRKKTMDAAYLAKFAEIQLCPENHSFFSRSKKFGLVREISSWSTHEPIRGLPTSTVMLFRSPSQRILSAYYFGKHLWGAEMKNNDGTISSSRFQAWRQFASRPSQTARNFAATPGVNACQTKMMMGCYCATRMLNATRMACPYHWRSLDASLLYQARKKISQLAFVGIQDFFAASVCLFHRKFGGSFNPKFELALFNLSPSRGGIKHQLVHPDNAQLSKDRWNESELLDFIDAFDEPLFASALDRFIADLILFASSPYLRSQLFSLPRLPPLPEPQPPHFPLS